MDSGTDESGNSTPKARKWATGDDFIKHRKLITDLYHNTTLPNLMRKMEQDHQFFATEKMFKTRFRRWGLWKHNKAGNVAEIVRLKKQRDAAHKSSEFILNGRRVDLERIETYLRRSSGKVRQYVESALESAVAVDPQSPAPSSQAAAARISAMALICRTPSPELHETRMRPPDELRSEENMYHAIRNYYAGAFSSQRWVFEEDLPPGPRDPSQMLAITQTKEGVDQGQAIWLRFRTALKLLERPAIVPNPDTGKKTDFSEGVRLMRIAFAELSQNILSGREAPMLLFWILNVMMLFRESSTRDFRYVENQLLKHLFELTSAAPSGSRHATSFFWQALWSGGQGVSCDRYHLQRCCAVALEQFRRHIPSAHSQSVELVVFSILSSSPPGVGDPSYKETRYRDLWQQVSATDLCSQALLDVLCCWAVHRRHYDPESAERLLLDEALEHPTRAALLPKFPGGTFNVHSLLMTINTGLKRYDKAEYYTRRGIDIAREARKTTNEDGDLFEGLNGLEVILRAQGRVADAEAVLLERKALVKESLEKVGEKEDSA